MSTIRQTVQDSLRAHGLSSYERQAEPVIADLESKAFEVADTLRHAAQRAGVSRDEATRAIEAAGLSFRPEPVPATGSGSEADVASLAAAVERLTAFARRHGFTG